MSLISGFDAIIAGCIDPLHPDFFLTEAKAGYQVKCVYGVNKLFWRTFDDLVLKWVCPGFPTTLGMEFYEHFDAPAITDPVIRIWGFVALCDIPPSGLGTSHWMYMATLNYTACQVATTQPRYIHIQYKHTNVGSVGVIRYPFSPPP
jgi:hypothetical protein